jgi:hypothetical protein
MEIRGRLLSSVALLAGVAVSSGLAQSRSLQSILTQERARIEQTDIRASGRLVEVAADGDRTNHTITLESHWFPDSGLRTLLTLDTPGQGTTRYLLSMESSGRTSIEVLRPGETAPTRLPVNEWSQGVAGTLFAPEDFFDGQFFWMRQTLLPNQNYGARACFVLKSEPGPGQLSQYARVTTFLDQKTLAPVYVEAAPRNGAARQFVFYDLEANGGVWNSRQVEAKRTGQPGSSLLLIEHGSPHAHLDRKDFSLTPSKPTRSKPTTP